MSADPRIPVFLARAAEPAEDGVFWLRAEEGRAAPEASPHGFGCACCIARSPLASRLQALIRARAVGEVPFFHRVGIILEEPGDAAAILALVEADLYLSRLYRHEARGA